MTREEEPQNINRNMTSDIRQYLVHSERRTADTSAPISWHRVPCITTMENGIHHIRMHYTHFLTDPSSVIALYSKMQSVGAT